VSKKRVASKRQIVALFRDEITPEIQKWARRNACLLVKIDHDAGNFKRLFVVRNEKLERAAWKW